jgi:hypothetical protein
LAVCLDIRQHVHARREGTLRMIHVSGLASQPR